MVHYADMDILHNEDVAPMISKDWWFCSLQMQAHISMERTS